LGMRHWKALLYVLSVVFPTILRTRHRPVIFNRESGMGDIICTIPAARELMKRHPGATFLYNCHTDFAAVPKLAGVADRITSCAHIGLVGYWYRLLLAGFYHFAHRDDTPGQVAREPMVMEFCRQFNVPVATTHPELHAPPTARERVRSQLAKNKLDSGQLILLHTGPSWPVKEWPIENWTALVSGLRYHGFDCIAQLGVNRYLIFDEVKLGLVPGAVSLVGDLSLEECLAVISRASLFVGIDSGLLHIAASTRTPSVGIFGSTLPKFFYTEHEHCSFAVSSVECAGCYHRRPLLHWHTNCPNDIQCMKSIPVDTVLDACLKKLAP